MNDSVLRAILATPDHRCECRAIRWSDADDVRQQAALDSLSLGEEVDNPEVMARFKVGRAACDIARREMYACRGRAVTYEMSVYESQMGRRLPRYEFDGGQESQTFRSDDASPVDEVIRNEADEELARAIDSLTPDQRLAIRFRYWHGLTVPETAAEMGLSESAVGGLLKRALRTLRVRYAT